MSTAVVEPDPTNFAGADARFVEDFATLSAFGATPNGGVNRLAGRAADGEQRTWLTHLLESHGFRVEFDQIGNQFGLMELVPGAPNNLAVVNWFNEEGARFTPSMMGSSVTIGVVDSNWAANKYELVVYGEQAHTGSTVIADRKDALLGASMLVVAAREIADKFPGLLHTSVGQLDVYPNSPVVVPSRVRLLLDLRSADEGVLAEADALLHARMAGIERQANVRVEKNSSHCWPVTPSQPAGGLLAEKMAADLGLPYDRVKTLAGHDSTNMKDIVPTVMLFVPSVEGISHNEHEYTRDEDIVAGLHMLTGVLERLAEAELDCE